MRKLRSGRGVQQGPDRDLPRQRGAVAVEFALVVPLLLLVLFGIIDFGAAFQKWNVAANAAREGARRAAVTSDTTDITNRALAVAHTLDATRLTVTLTCSRDGSAFGTCPSPWQSGDLVRVAVKYRYSFITPVGEMLKRSGDMDLNATSEVRFEG